MITEVNNTMVKLVGLSTDTMPSDVANGSELFAMDTGATYYYDADSETWITPS